MFLRPNEPPLFLDVEIESYRKNSGIANWRIQGDTRDARPPLGPSSLIFMQFSATILKNNKLARPRELSLSLGNPGSATEWLTYMRIYTRDYMYWSSL